MKNLITKTHTSSFVNIDNDEQIVTYIINQFHTFINVVRAVLGISPKYMTMSIIFCLASFRTNSQIILNNDSLVSDFKYLTTQLEATHPDPYSGFGGRVFFFKTTHKVIEDIRKNHYTQQAFIDTINAFLSNLQDGHTHIFKPDNSEELTRYAPIRFKVIPEQLIVEGIRTKNKELIGSRLDSINGVAVNNWLNYVASQVPCENLYGRYSMLSRVAYKNTFLNRFSTNSNDSVRYSLHTPDDKTVSLTFSYIAEDSLQYFDMTYTPEWKNYPSGYISYAFTDNSKQTMLFRASLIMARENFDYTLAHQWENAYSQMQDFYKYTLRHEMPKDTTEALAGIPSFSATFANMLMEMKKNQSKNLIIDLRRNSGGWTPITLPTLLMLYGDRYLTTEKNIIFYRRISPLYLNKINKTLEQYNEGNHSDYQLGDYVLDEENITANTSSINEQRKDFIDNSMSMSNTRKMLSDLQGTPLYQPQKVYVITDEKTFSAAFHYAFYLWKMGAIIVGVPSSQAPNTFMEQTPFQLPYGKLNGCISNSLQVFMPAQDRRAKTFYPDSIPTYQTYKKFNFDYHTEIRYLLDFIKESHQ